MPWTEIKPVKFKPYIGLSKSITDFRNLSDTRVEQSNAFSIVNKQAKRFKEQQDYTKKPLNFEVFREEDELLKKEQKAFKDLDKKIDKVTYKNLSDDLPGIEADEDKMERNDKWLEILNKDFYIFEATEVLSDIIS